MMMPSKLKHLIRRMSRGNVNIWKRFIATTRYRAFLSSIPYWSKINTYSEMILFWYDIHVIAHLLKIISISDHSLLSHESWWISYNRMYSHKHTGTGEGEVDASGSPANGTLAFRLDWVHVAVCQLFVFRKKPCVKLMKSNNASIATHINIVRFSTWSCQKKNAKSSGKLRARYLPRNGKYHHPIICPRSPNYSFSLFHSYQTTMSSRCSGQYLSCRF